MPLDARLHAPVPERRTVTRGRPRKRGPRLPSPEQMLKKQRARQLTLRLYGRHDKVRVVEGVASRVARSKWLLLNPSREVGRCKRSTPPSAPPGLPRIRTCGTTASGSSAHGFATSRRPRRLAPSLALNQPAIRRSRVDTVVGLGVPAVFPSCGSMLRRPLPSTGSGQVRSPASSVTTRRSDSLTILPPGFVSFAVAVPPPPVVPSQGGRAPILHRPGLLTGFPHRTFDVESSGPPRFLGDPSVHVPRSSTPAKPGNQALAAPRCCLPLFRWRRLSRHCSLSGLNHAARALAVYASRPGSPRHHARLATGWWPPLPDRGCTCWVPREVSAPLVTTASLPPHPGFAWRTETVNFGDAGVLQMRCELHLFPRPLPPLAV
jgi:hypothetical protein